MNYDVDYFIEKFEAIPEEKWLTGGLNDYEGTGNHCMLGHCGLKVMSPYYNKKDFTDEIEALFKLCNAELNVVTEDGLEMGPEWGKVYDINDRPTDNAKHNVLTNLRKMKDEQKA